MVKKVKAAVIGCGGVSHTYLRNLTKEFSIIEVVGCSDLIEERSRKRAEEFGIKQMTNEEIFKDPDIEIVVNLTYPLSHFFVSKEALEAGKHVFVEKMMSVNYPQAKELYELAKKLNLRIGATPDTFLGGGLQTGRKLIDAGFIGDPISAQAMCIRGYHLGGEHKGDRLPFVFCEGGNIPYDLGGYYLHAIIALLGPIKRVAGFASPFKNEITHRNPRHPDYHVPIPYTLETNLTSSLELHSGVLANFTVTSESHLMEIPRLEIYGTEGTLILPDPNTFQGPVKLIRGPANSPEPIPLTHAYGEDRPDPGPDVASNEERAWRNSFRGIGVADMAWAIRNNRAHRCSAELGLHAIETIYGIEKSCKEDKFYTMTSKPVQPEPLPSNTLSGSAAEECFDT